MTKQAEADDGRLSFMQAVAHVARHGQPLFTAMPVFGERTDDAGQTAEGARVFIIESDPEDAGDWRLRFIAGPFFSAAYAANEIMVPDEVPPSVRELRFMPTRCQDEWFTEPIQLLIQKLVQGAHIDAQMPDYSKVSNIGAGPEAIFPVHFIKGAGEPQ